MSMHEIALDRLSLSQLRQLEKDVPKEIDRQEREQRRLAFEAVEKRAAEMGLSKSDLRARFGGGGSNGKAPKPDKLYRHPETGQTWAGRGRRPQWVTRFEEEGGRLESLQVETSLRNGSWP